MDNTKKSSGSSRVGILDELRGFAIICMVVYHAMYDLKYLFGLDIPIFFDGWFDVIRDIFAGLFIFISGTVCRYSSNNIKRGAQCFFIGMIMTFVMPFFTSGTVMFGILHIPFQGSWLLMNMLTALFVVATQALGLFLFSLFPAISLIISIVSMVGSLGATLSGVTFPVPNMYPLVRDASYLFPVRHFTEMMQNMLYGGSGFIHLWPSAVILCIFPLLALVLLPHLKRAIESHKYEKIK